MVFVFTTSILIVNNGKGVNQGFALKSRLIYKNNYWIDQLNMVMELFMLNNQGAIFSKIATIWRSFPSFYCYRQG